MTGQEIEQLDTLFKSRLNEALRTFKAELIEELNIPQKPWLSKRKAYKRYGQANVDNWIEMKTVEFVQRANRIEINVADLEKQAAKKQLIVKR